MRLIEDTDGPDEADGVEGKDEKTKKEENCQLKVLSEKSKRFNSCDESTLTLTRVTNPIPS